MYNGSSYIHDVIKTCPSYKDYSQMIGKMNGSVMRVMHGAHGLAKESGEFLDNIHRHIFYGKSFDLENAKEEMGDICWYLGILCYELGVTFEQIWSENIEKLKKRYPNEQFSATDALARADKQQP